MRLIVVDGDQRIETVAHRCRQALGHAFRQQRPGLVSGSPNRAAQHRIGRCENVLVAEPDARPRQQRGGPLEPQRLVLEEPRQPFSGGGVPRAQTQVLTDALLMLGDRLLPAGVGVDRLGVGPQLQGREPQDLPVDLQGRLLREPAEHEGDLVREAQPIVGAASQGDLSSVGLEEGGIANQAGAGDVGVGNRHDSVGNKGSFSPYSSAAGNMTRSVSLHLSDKLPEAAFDGQAVRTVAYLRVSTPEQDVRSQRLAILEYAQKHDLHIDDFIEATASGQASEKRRRLDELMNVLHRGDRLVVSELSRLGRSLGQIVAILDALAKAGVAFVALKENTSASRAKRDVQTKVMTTLFALFAEVERDLISERTREGLAKGQSLGPQARARPKGSLGVSRLDGKEDEIRRFLELGVSKTAIAKITGVSRTALYSFVPGTGRQAGQSSRRSRSTSMDSPCKK